MSQGWCKESIGIKEHFLFKTINLEKECEETLIAFTVAAKGESGVWEFCKYKVLQLL